MIETAEQDDYCPHCGVNLWAEQGGTHYRRSVGILSTHDLKDETVLFHACIKCWGTWHHWPENHPLAATADRMAAKFTAQMRRKTT